MLDPADIHRLISQPGADQTLSLYLTVDAARLENHAAVPGWRIWAKNALRELQAQHEGDEAFAALRQRAEARLDQHTSHAKGLALFLTPHGEQVFELPVPLTESSASYGRASLAGLMWLLDEYQKTLIVIVDQERSRFISGYMGSASREGSHNNDFVAYDFPEKTQMPSGHLRGSRVAGGSNRDSFAATEADHRRRFYQEVAEQARHIKEELRVERVIIGGNEEAAHAVKHEMHDSVARSVIAVVSIPNWVDDAEVVRLASPYAIAYEREREVALVDEAIDFARSGGRGAIGFAEIAECLARKQVELLILPWPIEDPELRDRLPREALAAGAKIELVSGAAGERVHEAGGAVARLFYVIHAEVADAAAATQ